LNVQVEAAVLAVQGKHAIMFRPVCSIGKLAPLPPQTVLLVVVAGISYCFIYPKTNHFALKAFE
jgi:hypothetical protein